jgi:putative transcription factor
MIYIEFTGVVRLQCEVCGREIIGKPHRVIIEGAKMITCSECASLGSDYWIPETKTLQKGKPLRSGEAAKTPAVTKSASPTKSSAQTIGFSEGIEIVEGFGSIIKRAREKLNLTPEDLGKKIGEKESVIKRIESEKIVPDIKLAMKIERALKIKILSKSVEPETSKSIAMPKYDKAVTLGEIVHLKIGKRGREKNEGDTGIS